MATFAKVVWLRDSRRLDAPASPPAFSRFLTRLADVGQRLRNISARRPVGPTKRVVEADPFVVAACQRFVVGNQINTELLADRQFLRESTSKWTTAEFILTFVVRTRRRTRQRIENSIGLVRKPAPLKNDHRLPKSYFHRPHVCRR